jgi:hypothetical protein
MSPDLKYFEGQLLHSYGPIFGKIFKTVSLLKPPEFGLICGLASSMEFSGNTREPTSTPKNKQWLPSESNLSRLL